MLQHIIMWLLFKKGEKRLRPAFQVQWNAFESGHSQFNTAQKMKLSMKDFFSKSFLRIWSHLLKKSLMENFIFCAV